MCRSLFILTTLCFLAAPAPSHAIDSYDLGGGFSYDFDSFFRGGALGIPTNLGDWETRVNLHLAFRSEDDDVLDQTTMAFISDFDFRSPFAETGSSTLYAGIGPSIAFVNTSVDLPGGDYDDSGFTIGIPPFLGLETGQGSGKFFAELFFRASFIDPLDEPADFSGSDYSGLRIGYPCRL